MILKRFSTDVAALQFVAGFLACVGPLHTHAVVFDIDDTMIHAADGAPNPALTLFWALCGTLGLRRYIVTARPNVTLPSGEENQAVTVAELHAHGIRGWDALFLMPEREFQQCDGDAGHYKRRVRKNIVHDLNGGVPALLNIGDQWSDMAAARRPARDGSIAVGFFDDTAVLGIKLVSAR